MSAIEFDSHVWRELSRLINQLEFEQEIRLKSTHARFNVFTTLLKASDEVRLHTRFLAQLLNPTGTHDCGDLFLQLFFQMLQVHPPLTHDGEEQEVEPSQFQGEQWSIETETRKNKGQLDILLSASSAAIVIENKIYHHEGHRQIARYGEYLQSLPHEDSSKILLFLTLNGSEATTHEGHFYLRLSYHTHILEWLELCLQQTYQIPQINQVLIQYKAVVQELTRTNLEASAMDEIKDFLLKNPKIISQLPRLYEGIEELYRELVFAFLQSLKDELADKYYVTERAQMLPPKQENFPGLVLRPIVGDFTTDASYEIWVERNQNDHLICGIESAWQKTASDAEKSHLAKAKDYISATYSKKDFSDGGYHKSWNQTEYCLGVHIVLDHFTCGKTDFSVFINEQFRREALDACKAEIDKTVGIMRIALEQTSEL